MKVLIPVLILAYLAWRMISVLRIKKQLPELIAGGAQVVDVRSPAEYAGGHYDKSINIPLGELAAKASRLNPELPVIVCCASGVRSASAATILRDKGFKNVVNTGAWSNVQL